MAKTARGGTSAQNVAGTGGNLHPVVSGVYILFRNQKVTYLGKSYDVYGRVAAHRTKGRKFDLALVSACPPEHLDWVEKALIEAYRPPENKNHAKPKQIVAPVQVTAPADGLPVSDDMVISRPAASAHIRAYGIRRGLFVEALASGALASRQDRDRGPIRIRVGDLRAWRQSNLPGVAT